MRRHGIGMFHEHTAIAVFTAGAGSDTITRGEWLIECIVDLEKNVPNTMTARATLTHPLSDFFYFVLVKMFEINPLNESQFVNKHLSNRPVHARASTNVGTF
jgi:hypothetical protein